MNQKIIWCTLLGVGLFNQVCGTRVQDLYAIKKSDAIRTIIRTPISDSSEAKAALKTVGCDSDDQHAQEVLRVSNDLALHITDNIALSMSSIPGCDFKFKNKLRRELSVKLFSISSNALLSFFVPTDEYPDELSFIIREAKILRTDSLEKIIADSYKLGYKLRCAVLKKIGDTFVNTTDLEKLLPGCCVLLSKQISTLTQDKAVRHVQMIGNIVGNVIASTISRALYSNVHSPLDPEYVGRAKRYNLITIQVLDAIRVIRFGVPLKYDGVDFFVEPHIKRIEKLIQDSETCWYDRHACCRICSEWIYLMRELYMQNLDPDQCDTNKLMEDIISRHGITISRELFESLSPMRKIAQQLMEIDKPFSL